MLYNRCFPSLLKTFSLFWFWSQTFIPFIFAMTASYIFPNEAYRLRLTALVLLEEFLTSHCGQNSGFDCCSRKCHPLIRNIFWQRLLLLISARFIFYPSWSAVTQLCSSYVPDNHLTSSLRTQNLNFVSVPRSCLKTFGEWGLEATFTFEMPHPHLWDEWSTKQSKIKLNRFRKPSDSNWNFYSIV